MMKVFKSQIGNFDLAAAVATHITLLEEHQQTVGVPRPMPAIALVEECIKRTIHPIKEEKPDSFSPHYQLIDDTYEHSLEGRKAHLKGDVGAAYAKRVAELYPRAQVEAMHAERTRINAADGEWMAKRNPVATRLVNEANKRQVEAASRPAEEAPPPPTLTAEETEYATNMWRPQSVGERFVLDALEHMTQHIAAMSAKVHEYTIQIDALTEETIKTFTFEIA